jgi:hypothetical protein
MHAIVLTNQSKGQRFPGNRTSGNGTLECQKKKQKVENKKKLYKTCKTVQLGNNIIY